MRRTIIAITIAASISVFSFGQNYQLIQDSVDKWDFPKAEQLVTQELKTHPDDFMLSVIYNQVLNSQGKYADAIAAREKLLNIWNKTKKEDFLKRGSLVGESTWAALLDKTDKYYIIGTEYFIPEILGANEPTITNFFKIIVYKVDTGDFFKLYKLEMSNIIQEYYVLSEIDVEKGSFKQVLPYGSKKPQLNEIVFQLKKMLK